MLKTAQLLFYAVVGQMPTLTGKQQQRVEAMEIRPCTGAGRPGMSILSLMNPR